MSSKINICCVISEHYDSLRDPVSGKYSFPDMITFVVIPFMIAALSFYSDIKLTNELVGLLVNFGSIITALLLSVLVLVYDQRNKIDDKVLSEKSSNTLLLLKQTVLSQLFSNICYATIISVSLVATCFLEQMIRPVAIDIASGAFVRIIHGWILSPLVFFLIAHVILTLLMIIKRMHTLLTAK
ncbi:hypothetical protein [Aeromonas veronii]|uniref:hypothetical protein n=1 Tax=Aeromonas veronii TaxID=654 RepID=UPI0032EE1D21